MVTIKDVSKRSGFSITTVSKALNDYPDISAKTKKYILDLCEEMKYVPNLSARSLISKKSYTIGIIFEEVTGAGLQHPVFSRVLESFKNKVEKEGYDILFLSKKIGNKNDSYLQHLKRKQIEAVLVLCAEFDSSDMVEIYHSEIPTVVIDFAAPQSLNITSSNKDGVFKAIRYLYQNGHQKIAHITGGEHTYIGSQRIAYFYEALDEMKLEKNSNFIVSGPDFTKEEGYEAMKQLLALTNQPTAVFCSSDLLAIGALQAITEAGLQVPNDFSIIGFDGIELGQVITPRLTTIKQDCQTMGEVAAQYIIENINAKTKLITGKTILVDCDLLIGESCKAIT